MFYSRGDTPAYEQQKCANEASKRAFKELMKNSRFNLIYIGSQHDLIKQLLTICSVFIDAAVTYILLVLLLETNVLE